MAIFDSENSRVVVRVVYDGPMTAGKTTNIRQLEHFFTRLRRSDVVVPGERGGRTLYFDWMHLDSGLVSGHPLRCQLVTVPGQRVLSRRRERILQNADAVVFVCESTEKGVGLAKGLTGTLTKRFADASGGLPIVLQANKQDLVGALDPEDVRRNVGLDPSIPVVAARAEEGIGVRESLVLAIRFAASAAQRQLLGGGVKTMAGAVEGPDELLRELQSIDATDGGTDIGELIDAANERIKSHNVNPPGVSSTPASPIPVRSGKSPPLPHPDLPLGHVWPAGRGREVLSALSPDQCQPRGDLVGKQGTEEGSASSDLLLFEAGDRCLKTSPRRWSHDLEEARAQLLQLVRTKRALGPLLLPDTVLALVPAENQEDGYWLWTVTPWVPTLRGRMATAAAEGKVASLASALTAFAEVSAKALSLCAQRGIILDLHPSNFGFGADGVCYLDDDVMQGTEIPIAAHALLQRIEEYSNFAPAIEIYLEAIEEHFRRELTREELASTGFEASLASTPARSSRAQEAKERLFRLLRRDRLQSRKP